MFDRFDHRDIFQPILLVVMDGWVDAGGAAQMAVERILDGREIEQIGTFDADALLDHRARRPVMRLEDGVVTDLTWPVIEVVLLRDDQAHDVVLLHGAEPDHSWSEFIDQVGDLAEELDVVMVVGLGAYPAPVPHTRSTRLACTASTAELARRLPFERATIEIPAGIQSAIEHDAAQREIPAIGLWAQVPHYIAGMGFPAAAAALLDGVADLTGVRFDPTPLRDQAVTTRRHVDELVTQDSEHQAMVRQLEALYDQQAAERAVEETADLPTGDELAAEVERFLRDQGEGNR